MSTSSIVPLFSSKPLVKLLSIFLLHPDQRYYQQELVRMTGESLRPLQLALGKLERAGLVGKTREGRNAYYRAVPGHPAFADLRNLFRKTVALGDVLRDALGALGERVQVAFVFGSFARGDEAADSDIDVIVIGHASLREVSDALGDASETLGREVNLVVYEPTEVQRRVREDSAFIAEVLGGPKIWLVGDEDELEQLAR